MQGQMMDYPLTLDRILEHANRLYPRKRITTVLPDGDRVTGTPTRTFTAGRSDSPARSAGWVSNPATA